MGLSFCVKSASSPSRIFASSYQKRSNFTPFELPTSCHMPVHTCAGWQTKANAFRCAKKIPAEIIQRLEVGGFPLYPAVGRTAQQRHGGLAGAGEAHHKPLGRVLAHAIGARAFAIEQLCRALGGGCIGQRLKDGLAQRGQQGGGSFVNLVAVGLRRRGGVGLRAGVAVLQVVAPGLGGLLNDC